MIQVLIVACLAGTAADVDPHKLEKEPTCGIHAKTYFEDPAKITPFACMLNAQKFAIEWLKNNPGYTIRKVGCKPYKGEFAEGL